MNCGVYPSEPVSLVGNRCRELLPEPAPSHDFWHSPLGWRHERARQSGGATLWWSARMAPG